MAEKSQPTPLSYKWILIGAAIIGGLNWLLRTLLLPVLALPLIEAMGVTVGLLAVVVVISFGSFFCGSALVAYLSPGNTIREPAIAAAIAVAVNSAHYAITSNDVSPLGIAIAVAIGYVFALGGARVGERLQGDTFDKMRERGELRR